MSLFFDKMYHGQRKWLILIVIQSHFSPGSDIKYSRHEKSAFLIGLILKHLYVCYGHLSGLCFYELSIGFWNCSDCVFLFCFFILIRILNWFRKVIQDLYNTKSIRACIFSWVCARLRVCALMIIHIFSKWKYEYIICFPFHILKIEVLFSTWSFRWRANLTMVLEMVTRTLGRKIVKWQIVKVFMKQKRNEIQRML